MDQLGRQSLSKSGPGLNGHCHVPRQYVPPNKSVLDDDDDDGEQLNIGQYVLPQWTFASFVLYIADKHQEDNTEDGANIEPTTTTLPGHGTLCPFRAKFKFQIQFPPTLEQTEL